MAADQTPVPRRNTDERAPSFAPRRWRCPAPCLIGVQHKSPLESHKHHLELGKQGRHHDVDIVNHLDMRDNIQILINLLHAFLQVVVLLGPVFEELGRSAAETPHVVPWDVSPGVAEHLLIQDHLEENIHLFVARLRAYRTVGCPLEEPLDRLSRLRYDH